MAICTFIQFHLMAENASLLKSTVSFTSSYDLVEISNESCSSVDLKNIDQPSTQNQQQQQATLVRPQESMPINVPNTASSTPMSSADD